jgi:hypothetical protein
MVIYMDWHFISPLVQIMALFSEQSFSENTRINLESIRSPPRNSILELEILKSRYGFIVLKKR